ncbi:VWA domain-containing protein [Persicobacter psychrovividus]|uniref:Membrane protein n=1 Tax=Persicobacter psychrovividus TaxID=387638 RepID=A0ABM7VJK2_9BACT|nr:membrane protein [Persicobacter psychrovividus]
MPENFEFAFPWIFILLPLPLLVYWFTPAFRTKSAAIKYPIFEHALQYTGERKRSASDIRKRSIFRWVPLFCCWVLLLVAMASPQLIGKPEMKVKNSRNFLILIDISFSMAQKDWEIEGKKVTRWEAVKQVMHQFIQKRAGDRVGLIFFASNAYIQAPFTADLKAVENLLEDTEVGFAGQMTRIGKGIMKGVNMFENDSIDSKVMLLLTDGVDDGTDILPLDAADIAQKDSITIYTIGIGTPGDKSGDLDEKTLKEIAEMSAGEYFLAQDRERLVQIYEQLDQLEPIEYEEEEYKPVTLLYPYPLGIAFGMLLLTTLTISVSNFIRSFKN